MDKLRNWLIAIGIESRIFAKTLLTNLSKLRIYLRKIPTINYI